MYKIVFATFLSLTAFSVHAGVPIGPIVPAFQAVTTNAESQTQTENRAFAGLVWTLKDKFSFIPDLTVGVRSLRVKSSDSVNGAEISARIKFQGGVALDSTRLSYIGGQRDFLGNLGVGYSFSNASILGTVAAQSAYSRVGTDFQFSDKSFVPYFELLTVDKPHNVDKKVTTTNNLLIN